MALRTSLAASIPSRLNSGGIRMSVTRTCGCNDGGPVDDFVVVRPHAHNTKVLVPLDEGFDTLADNEIVVGEKHRDRASSGTAVSSTAVVLTYAGRLRQVGTFPMPGGTRHTMRRLSPHSSAHTGR